MDSIANQTIVKITNIGISMVFFQVFYGIEKKNLCMDILASDIDIINMTDHIFLIYTLKFKFLFLNLTILNTFSTNKVSI
jgi:hypothetical protein